MRLTLDIGHGLETKSELPMGSALAGLACNAIEIEWTEFDRHIASEGIKRTFDYFNHVLRTKLLPGAELRIVQGEQK